MSDLSQLQKEIGILSGKVKRHAGRIAAFEAALIGLISSIPECPALSDEMRKQFNEQLKGFDSLPLDDYTRGMAEEISVLLIAATQAGARTEQARNGKPADGQP